MSFYSRFYIENIKLPELNAALSAKRNQRERNKLEQGIAGWESALVQDMNIIKANGPALLGDLFQSVEKEAMLFQIEENQSTLVLSSSYCPRCNTNPRP